MKRFTDTDKWTKDQWFSELEPRYKLFWLYLVDNCDNVGVWEVNERMMNFLIGYDFSTDALAKQLGDKIYLFDDGRKWWVRNFIDFQHGELSEESQSKPIMSYIALLKKHTLWEEYTNGIHTVQGKGKGKGGGKGKGKGKATEYTQEFEDFWVAFGRKGSKFNAFKRWKEHKEHIPADVSATAKQYLAFCASNDRTIRDAEGWISGRLWDSDWSIDTKPPAEKVDYAKILKEYK